MRTVCCVMLANGRERMVRRAIASWLNQTYSERHRMLLILDGAESPNGPGDAIGNPAGQAVGLGVIHLHRPAAAGMTIGALRNNANGRTNADIILHWDSDDWSHPNRIAEQVALLEASGKEAVGYRDMLFWDTTPPHPVYQAQAIREGFDGAAWLYTNRVPSYCLGTSLCYWREVWQRNPFADTSAGEDTLWLHNVKSLGQSSLAGSRDSANVIGQPRMIASIHGANTYAKIEPRAEEWKRVPEWDEHCRGVMAL